ncbi:hypothetical protein FZC78_05640 [Rossellomorea vietnamensis]|uniref:Uncharacterized protein n=1 Tax=Rossellomorea vietnamensis TaxID=218284 RepID=A0A5D4NX87_9BACI|nr:hypothetical protein FZC78_05640 [Rossellomorea vietnamensis]
MHSLFSFIGCGCWFRVNSFLFFFRSYFAFYFFFHFFCFISNFFRLSFFCNNISVLISTNI